MTAPSETDFTPVEHLAAGNDSPLLLLADHASNALPPEYGTLGLPQGQLDRHIGWDIGVAAVTRALSGRLGAEALLTRYSRLLIDPNRGEDDPTLVMRLSDGAVVPGNAAIDGEEVARRLERFHRPYHGAIAAALDARAAAGSVPAILSLHSFTPVWRGRERPWQAAVLWDRDPRLARPLIEALRAEGLTVGDNEPYDGALAGDTMHRHATLRGLPHALLEIRQDLIADAAGATAWAERLARILPPLLSGPAMTQVQHHGSRTDPAPAEGFAGLPPADRTELEAAVLRRLIAHFRRRTDVQNIDVMNLAGFCRNCLSNWMVDAAQATGRPLTRDEAREAVYGMPYERWKALYQAEAPAAAQAAFAAGSAVHHHEPPPA